MGSTGRSSDQFGLRLPDGMRDRLHDAAKANGRSANAEIIARLESSFQAGAASLDGEIAALIGRHVDAEVRRRLREIASNLGAA